ncbi:MAG: hypothetical protein M0R46_10825 [Candidatus Muirbacterium halophilum]|nr:hypothetical protein [Candidatus Muirbacterium halophilum]MCK9476407.1 hypothetical protein [Candidatus Muirbacterium halophilum]
MNESTTKGLSEIELKLVSRLTYEGKKIYQLDDIKKYLPNSYNNIKNLIMSLKNKKILIPIKKSVYIFVPIEFVNRGILVNELIIPSVFLNLKDYYIGYSTMYNYYNFYEQKFQVVYVLNTKISKVKKILGITYNFVKVDRNRIYGFFCKKLDNIEVPLATKEKTLIDLIYFNKPVGGIKNAINIFEKEIVSNNVDLEVLIEFAIKFPVVKTRKIIGFIVEKIVFSSKYKKKLSQLRASIDNTSLISITDGRKGGINKKWGLIINDSL